MCFTHFGLGALGLLFLNVHGQHLAAEREALGLLNHLLVRRYSVVPHDHMALEWMTGSREQSANQKWHCSHSIRQTSRHPHRLYSYLDNSMSFWRTGLWFADYRGLLWCLCQSTQAQHTITKDAYSGLNYRQKSDKMDVCRLCCYNGGTPGRVWTINSCLGTLFN